MQLELIGCTSSGKSTLATQMATVARANGIELAMGDDIVIRSLGVRDLPSRRLRAVAVHLRTFLECLTHGRKYATFLATARRSLRYSAIPRRRQWNQFRKVLKQLGRYELIRRSCHNEPFVLVDEGTLQSAHNLFVHVERGYDDSHVHAFAEQVPLPDLIVYVRLGEDPLIERTLRRGHPRIARSTRPSVTWFVRQAIQAFDEITRHPRIAARTLVIQDGKVVQRPSEHNSPGMRGIVDLIIQTVHGQAQASHTNQGFPPTSRPVVTA